MAGLTTTRFYESRGHTFAAAVALPVVNIVVVLLRFYTRKNQNWSIKIDDWLTVPALILLCGACATAITGIAQHALGYPNPFTAAPQSVAKLDRETSAHMVELATKIEYAMQIITIPALGAVKLSALFYYYRIFCPHKTGPTRLIIISAIVIVVLWTLCNLCVAVFACGTNVKLFFGAPSDRCINILLWLYTLSITDLITDVMVLVLPIPLLWKLQMPLKKKLAIGIIFLLGSVAIGASATRLAINKRYYRIGYHPPSDPNSTITGVIYWTLVELGIGLFASCLPTIQFLLRKASHTSGSKMTFPSFISSRFNGRENTYGFANRVPTSSLSGDLQAEHQRGWNELHDIPAPSCQRNGRRGEDSY